MTVAIIGFKGEYKQDVVPLSDETKQLFAAVKDGKPVDLFYVDHAEYNTASSFLQSNPNHRVVKNGYDYVRSATFDDVDALGMED